ncbi:PTS system transporter subunit IIC [Corynebacterium suranareeae]|uniref:PTS system transporter subunit IIC n=1 Tax=Corynebacterium suranareeae TaxID=2506452 RepID=A0A169SAM2_9CORY|nr:PTS fructose transporter subunit IIC [Corynebacterium suranareeae]BAU97350.1 PTS system transporter subunit IIC [Corynebacterium suranareeae]
MKDSLVTAWQKIGFKNHLLTAISYLIPVVTGAGFLIAIGMALGGSTSADLTDGSYTVWDAMAVMGAQGLGLLGMIISTGIAFSIAAKPGIAPGLIVGMTAIAVDAGFIGGLLGGFIAGFITLGVIRYLKVPQWARSLMPLVIVPLVASFLGGMIMVYVIGTPIQLLTTWLTEYLSSLGTASLLAYGIVIGVLAAIDYGGPINKTVFAFTLTLQAAGVNEPITALIVVNTATPLGFCAAHWIAKLFRKQIYTPVEKETLPSAFPMGLISIVESVLPIVLNDLVRCVLATGIGAAFGGATAMILGADATVPFGGFLVMPTLSTPWTFLVAVLVNAFVTGLVLALLKRDVRKIEHVLEVEEEDIDDAEIKIL